jgi:glycosyltransferase involved in cell wall biosynthesis
MIKKILVTDNQKIWPPDSGAPIRTFNMFKNLSKEYNITYLGTTAYDNFLHYEKQLTSNFKEKIIKIDKPILLFNSSLTKLARKVHTFDIVISAYEYFNKEFRETLSKEAKNANILIATHPWFFPHIRRFKNKTLVYDSHNCEYLLKKDDFKKTLIGRVLLLLIGYIEKTACKKSDLVIACSEENKESFKKLYKIKDEKIYVLPNSVDAEDIRPATEMERKKAKQALGLKNRKTILFVGTYYGPNNEALDFIIKDLSRLKDYTFLIAGNINLHFQKEYANKKVKNIRFYGKVSWKKLKLLYQASDLAINPMFNGSGINIKMLDYMAAGIPIVTTPIGIRGIKEIKNGKHAIVCSAEEFKKAIPGLMKDEEKKEKFRSKNRQIIEQYYDYKVINKKFYNILQTIKI